MVRNESKGTSSLRWLVSAVIFSLFIQGIAFASGKTDSKNPNVEIPLYTYHTHPPFIIDSNTGLSQDLANYLSVEFAGKYTFVVVPMSRIAVDREIEMNNGIGLVPWVSPAFFNDEDEEKYTWLKNALMKDGNAIISHQDLSLTYNGPNSLRGMVFGGITGHHYSGIDSFIKKDEKTRRVDAANHKDNFQKIIDKTINVTLTPLSGAEYIINKEGYENELYISPKLHSVFMRRMIISGDHSDLSNTINKKLELLFEDKKWKSILKSYR